MIATIFSEILESCRFCRIFSKVDNDYILFFFTLGYFGLLLPPNNPMPSLWQMIWTALAEELCWRVLIQNELELRWKGNVPNKNPSSCPLISFIQKADFSVSKANLLISAFFALAHLFTQPLIPALLTFFPSLIFGDLWTKHRSLWLCAGMHFWYNLMFFS